MKFIFSSCRIIILLLAVFNCSAQQMSTMEKNYLQLLRKEFNAGNAYKAVAFVEKYFRIAGNTGFNESIFYVEKILMQAGFVKEANGEGDNVLSYRIEKRPMKKPTWEPVDAQLFIAGEEKPLLEFKTNRNMLAINSGSTPAGGVTAELLYIGKGENKDFTEKNMKGKIVMMDRFNFKLYNGAINIGAIGVLAYDMPAYTKPEINQNSIQFGTIPYADSTQQWAIFLSCKARKELMTALEKGKVLVKVLNSSKIYPSEELTLIANVRGTIKPNERFVFSAHVQEPGANDNASGVGTLAEMARLTAALVKNKKISLQRSLSFLWGEEIISVDRFINEDPVRAKGIKWGISIDMVGEDTKKTGGSFLIEKIPDPSAIWTRGKDKHTEWGGTALKEKDLLPSYFTDLLLNRCLNEGKETGWEINTNPFEGGSDHIPFINAKLPGLLMWHFTDVFYHTDADRLDMVSAEEMKHVGISALLTAYLLATADTKTAVSLISEFEQNALRRLQTEFTLSKEAISTGKSKEEEKHIMEVWRDWYLKAIETAVDISVQGNKAIIRKAIDQSNAKIKFQVTGYLDRL